MKKQVRAWFPVFLVAAVALGVLFVFSPGNVQAQEGCLPTEYSQATVLARPGLGHAFLKLGGDGDAAPYLDPISGRVMVPVRSLVTLITPARDFTRWDEATRTATFQRGDRTLSFTFPPGSHRTDTARLQGQTVSVDAYICNGKVVAPARFVAGALNSGIRWYRDNTVVVDPAWGPDSETLALQVGAGATLSPGRPSLAGGRIGGSSPAATSIGARAAARLGKIAAQPAQ